MADKIIGPQRGLDAPALVQNDGQFDTTLDFKNGRQSVPDPNTKGDGQYNFTESLGEKELLGQGAQAADEGIHDDEYPSVPNLTLPGEPVAGTGESSGGTVEFSSVAPVKYPWPKDTYSAGITDATGARSGAGG